MSSRPKLSIKKRQKPKSSNSSGSSEESELNYKNKPQKVLSPQKVKKSDGKKSLQKIPNFPIKNIYHPNLFINNLDNIKRFKCGLCKCICENPKYQYCGCNQAYCKKCLNFYYECYENQCPKCRKETKELEPQSNYYESLYNLNMKCVNYNLKCLWTGKYKDYKDHINNQCPKETINCPNKGCVIKLKREEMNKHINKCEYHNTYCNKCLTKMTLLEKKTHKSFCPREEIECPQGCGESFEREDFSMHKKKCPNTEISCPYKSFGCKDKYPRNKRDERLMKDAYKHLDLTANIILDLKKKISKMEKEIDQLKNKPVDMPYIDNIINNNEEEEVNFDNNANNKNNGKNKDSDSINEITNEIEINSNQFLSKKRVNNNINVDEEISYQEKSNNFSLFNNYHGNEINNDLDELSRGKTINNNIYEIPSDYKHLFKLNNEILEAKLLDGKKHYFVFFNQRYDIPKNSDKKYSFIVKLLTKCDWLDIGICDKKILELNNFEFDIKNNNKLNEGKYFININGLLWNSNEIKECIKISKKYCNQDEVAIICTVNPKMSEIEFMINDESFDILTNVKCVISDSFSPFLTFLKNCKIQINFDYQN
jgi:hypothetical protein